MTRLLIMCLSASFVVGSVVGFVDIASAYSGAPRRVLVCWASLLFVFINGAIGALAAGALYLLQPILFERSLHAAIVATISGLGGSAILRSSILRVSPYKTDVKVAPFLDKLLDVVDRRIQDVEHKLMMPALKQAMEGVDFAKAANYLPAVCLTRRRVTKKDPNVAKLKTFLVRLSEAGDTDHSKCVRLGLELCRCSSLDVVLCAINSTDLRIKRNGVDGKGEDVTIDELKRFYGSR